MTTNRTERHIACHEKTPAPLPPPFSQRQLYRDAAGHTAYAGEYIDYYLTERKHSALGYLTPQQFESLRQSN